MRLFVAGDLPAAVRAALAVHGRALAAAGGWRAVAEPSLHLTLAFLGERPEEDVERIGAALPGTVLACGPVRLGAAILLPRRGPRVAAVELVDPGDDLARLQASVGAALAELNAYRPETRRYLPHVTVARRTREERGREPEPDWSAVAPFHLPSVTLYRSALARAGARYEPLASVALPARSLDP